jgi:hypothetical protein
MTAKEAREIINGMELSKETLDEVEAILGAYAETDEIPEEVINNVLLIVDKEVDINKLVEDGEEINSLL